MQGRRWQLPGSALPMLSSQMLRTRWVLNWPGQVTIAGCQTYWTLEVEEALEAGNLSSRLFPQLAQQVRLKAGGHHLLPTNTPHPEAAQSLQELRHVLILEEVLGLEPKSRGSDTPETSVS